MDGDGVSQRPSFESPFHNRSVEWESSIPDESLSGRAFQENVTQESSKFLELKPQQQQQQQQDHRNMASAERQQGQEGDIKADPSMYIPGSQGENEGALQVLNEGIVYKRFLTVYNRTVRFPPDMKHGETQKEEEAGPAVAFDLVGHPRANFKFTVTFPFHSPEVPDGEARVTLIREYCQAMNGMSYVLPTGGFDMAKHASMAECAAAELSEEAHLHGGKLQCLLPEDNPGIPEGKWCLNRFIPFLVINPKADIAPGVRDLEEAMIEVHCVSVQELKNIMISGLMQPPSIITCSLALDYLAKHNFL
ncbi:hypothetical protein CYMTET_23728 [Cymbomonas tetramitiformis]|uniref:Nudix hydrolase domain-containing protein n=1 Tax=Cymbomonas tetramitiformis TaxID=36881 RepID=A0AAE0FXD9_9CHLO|nr:hypothetical protein CYMTET_23728 [Cymbomonas tetramitiformis]